jgi:hypothetical protein
MGKCSHANAPAKTAVSIKVDRVKNTLHEAFFREVMLFRALEAGRLKPWILWVSQRRS